MVSSTIVVAVVLVTVHSLSVNKVTQGEVTEGSGADDEQELGDSVQTFLVLLDLLAVFLNVLKELN